MSEQHTGPRQLLFPHYHSISASCHHHFSPGVLKQRLVLPSAFPLGPQKSILNTIVRMILTPKSDCATLHLQPSRSSRYCLVLKLTSLQGPRRSCITRTPALSEISFIVTHLNNWDTLWEIYVRWFHCCVYITECTFTNLDGMKPTTQLGYMV